MLEFVEVKQGEFQHLRISWLFDIIAHRATARVMARFLTDADTRTEEYFWHAAAVERKQCLRFSALALQAFTLRLVSTPPPPTLSTSPKQEAQGARSKIAGAQNGRGRELDGGDKKR